MVFIGSEIIQRACIHCTIHYWRFGSIAWIRNVIIINFMEWTFHLFSHVFLFKALVFQFSSLILSIVSIDQYEECISFQNHYIVITLLINRILVWINHLAILPSRNISSPLFLPATSPPPFLSLPHLPTCHIPHFTSSPHSPPAPQSKSSNP